VVNAARGFDLIEIEGDAAFLSREADTLDGDARRSPPSPRLFSPCIALSTWNGAWSNSTCARATVALRRAT
jgi:hypothetical protein